MPLIGCNNRDLALENSFVGSLYFIHQTSITMSDRQQAGGAIELWYQKEKLNWKSVLKVTERQLGEKKKQVKETCKA